MDIKQILTADVLDIIFEGRNKSYGAYELRKTYNQRILTALACSALIVGLLYSGYLLADNHKVAAIMPPIEDVVLDLVPIEETEPPVIPPKPQETVPVEQISSTIPRIVPNDQVLETEMPPQDEIANARISMESLKGSADDGTVAPPLEGETKGLVSAPQKKTDNLDSVFLKVEIESEYPGGASSWTRFLIKTLSNYPEEALEKGVQGTVVVKFIVDREGNVSNIEADSGPEELREAAVKAIKKSGKWIPAQQNGNKVNSYKKQPITFRTSEN